MTEAMKLILRGQTGLVLDDPKVFTARGEVNQHNKVS